MSHTDYEMALAEFLRRKGITRCPTACVAPTQRSVAGTDRAALRSHKDAREATRTLSFVARRVVARRIAIAPSAATPDLRSAILTR